MARFVDRVVLITGSSDGIGAETAVDFAREGARVVVTGRQEAKLQTTVERCIAAGAREENVLSIAGDLTVEEDVHRIVDSAVDKFGTIHILVNNAGAHAPGSTVGGDMAVIDRSYQVNLRSVLIVTKRALPHILKNKDKGSIVNVGSIAGTLPVFSCIGYSIMKAAVHHFTKCLANEVADQGVRVNAVAPGTIANDVLIRPGAALENQPEKLEEFWQFVAPMHPLGRIGHMDEVSKAIRFLASDEASFTTGTVMPVDGGRHTGAIGKSSQEITPRK